MELPLVVVNVQRGGPSTGLPTKTEQADLLQAMYGRNGESPMPVIAASRPSDCYEMAYAAAKMALEHMTPVMLLTDGYIANGAEPWRIPDDLAAAFPKINHKQISQPKSDDEPFLGYKRDENLVRDWAIPGMAGYEHRIGGLEKHELTGNVSHDPINHEKMVRTRQAKVDKISDFIPAQEVEGEMTGDILVISWGGTYGATHSAVKALQKDGKKVSLAHLKYINPMPNNIEQIIKGFKKVFIPELNNGQLKFIIDGKYKPNSVGYNKIQGLYLTVTELVTAINRELETL
jgi:2-oxoglutarate ferredoxin oxidoreductase subunit alpha